MKWKQLIVIIFVFCVHIQAQVYPVVNAYSLSVSGATTTTEGINTITENQGGLAFCRKSALALNYANRYSLYEISSQSLGFILPVGKSTLGLTGIYYGDKILNEGKYSLAYGRKLFKWLGAGILVNYHHVNAEAVNERFNAISGDLGLQVNTENGLQMGLELINLTHSKFMSLNDYSLYSGLLFGSSYTDRETFKIISQLNWNNYQYIDLVFAGEYWLFKFMAVRLGVKVNRDPTWSFGTGFKYNKFLLDIGMEHHPILGLSSSISLIYQIRDYEGY